jgi:hypothetical protein
MPTDLYWNPTQEITLRETEFAQTGKVFAIDRLIRVARCTEITAAANRAKALLQKLNVTAQTAAGKGSRHPRGGKISTKEPRNRLVLERVHG